MGQGNRKRPHKRKIAGRIKPKGGGIVLQVIGSRNQEEAIDALREMLKIARSAHQTPCKE